MNHSLKEYPRMTDILDVHLYVLHVLGLVMVPRNAVPALRRIFLRILHQF